MSTSTARLRLAPKPTTDPRREAMQFRSDLADHARSLRGHVPQLTPSEDYLLSDFARFRMPMSPFVRLAMITARSTMARHRVALATAVQGLVAAMAAPVQLVRDELLDAEDVSNSAADVALRRYLTCRCPAHLRAAVEAHEQQLVASQRVLEWLDAERRTLTPVA